MKSKWLAAGAALLMLACAVDAQVPAADPTGDWRATAALPGTPVRLRMALHLGQASTFDSPDQGAVGIPAKMTREGRHVVVEIAGVGHFEGQLSEGGDALEGTFNAGPTAIPVKFERGSFAVAQRPQTPTPPFPYRAEEVSYSNPQAPGVSLAGTLTLPDGAGPFPAVLLITGSGSQDRDETIFEHKPFMVLADALTRRGVAVLRLDDRGIGGSSAGPPGATTLDFAADVEAGLAYLRSRKDIDARRIGLLGHSEGGLIASIVAAYDARVAFIVLWAGQGLSGRDVIVGQSRAVAAAMGADPKAADNTASLQAALLDAVLATPDQAELGTALNAVTASHDAPALDAGTIATLGSPWYRTYLSLDPRPSLRKLKIPVLALLGGKDPQVIAAENAPALRAALAHDPKATVEVLPGLNHLFQTAQTGGPEEFGKIEETIAPAALARMVDWIVTVTGSK